MIKSILLLFDITLWNNTTSYHVSTDNTTSRWFELRSLYAWDHHLLLRYKAVESLTFLILNGQVLHMHGTLIDTFFLCFEQVLVVERSHTAIEATIDHPCIDFMWHFLIFSVKRLNLRSIWVSHNQFFNWNKESFSFFSCLLCTLHVTWLYYFITLFHQL